MVERYKYLGDWINRKGDPEEEIMFRIGQAKSAFAKMKKTLTSHQSSLNIRTRALKCYVWSVLLYGCEVWTLKVNIMNRIEAFEMRCYR